MRWLDATRIPAMIIGGVAVSALGRPRLTQDVDALVSLPESKWAESLTSAAAYGLQPRIEDALDFARRSRVLLLRHSLSGIDIDVTFAALPFELAAISRRARLELGGVRVPLPRVEDLLVMKAIAHRPKDIEDLRGLLAAHPAADVEAAREWIREFAAAMNMPDLLRDFDALLVKGHAKP